MQFDIQNFYAAIRNHQDPEQFGEGVSSETSHYLNVFQKDQRVNWNWMAFLFAPIWMLYRRLYAAYILLMTGVYPFIIFTRWLAMDRVSHQHWNRSIG